MEDIKILIVNESDSKSIASDIFTFVCLLGAFWINYEHLGNGLVLQITLAICFFVAAAGKGSRKIRRMKPKEAKAYLDAQLS